jgi:hypothetical protein
LAETRNAEALPRLRLDRVALGKRPPTWVILGWADDAESIESERGDENVENSTEKLEADRNIG